VDPKLKAEKIILASILWSDFWVCPTTKRVLASGDMGDDKVLCNCAVAMASGGTHHKRMLVPSTAESYVEDYYRRNK
jgi:hypothetical protein